jgi:hypothetical protein
MSIKFNTQGDIQTKKWLDNNGVEKYITETILQNQLLWYCSKVKMLIKY